MTDSAYISGLGIDPVAPTGPTRKQLDLPALRTRLQQQGGRRYWRSLDELAETEAFRQLLEREFPENASQWSDGSSRRTFLKLMGASLALGGLAGCTIQPEEKIVPWIRAPENQLPGHPLYYATAATLGGVGVGLLATSYEGRPIKVDGNPDHPGSLGATHPAVQASILDLYDPDRSQTVKNAGRISSWGSFMGALSPVLAGHAARKGEGLRVLSGNVTSPTLGALLQTWLKAMPQARWHQFEATRGDGLIGGSKLAFGEALNTYYDLARADVILSLDADLFFSGPGAMRYASDFMRRRTAALHDGGTIPNRLYVAEVSPTATGSIADHRFRLDTGALEAFAAAVAVRLGVRVGSAGEIRPDPDSAARVEAVAADLLAHRGAGAVVVGEHQCAALHALAHAMNLALDNVGRTVHLTDPIEVAPSEHATSFSELVDDMRAGAVDTLIMIGVNPSFEAPAALDFDQALAEVDLRIHLGSHEDETAFQCHWHIPQSHYLESWGDVRAYDGTVSIVQPLILPLYPSRSAYELIALLAGQPGKSVLDLVRDYWSQQPSLAGRGNFDAAWQQALHDGTVPHTRLPDRQVQRRDFQLPAGFGRPLDPESDLELCLRPDPYLGAGATANNGWLQETPRPVTKLTWDNAALLSPATAERLGVSNGQVVQIRLPSGSAELPAWIVPGQADGVILTHLGFGRRRGGRVADGVGVDVTALRPAAGAWSISAPQVSKTQSTRALACTQDHSSMEGRGLVRHADLEEFSQRPHFVHEDYGEEFPRDLTLFTDHVYDAPNQWGMAIDLTACIGCNGCSVACQAENNIPIVGKEHVLNGREMAWIRIDRYYTDLDDPEILHQPIPCQQCENAPCEVVCPVTATSHSEEGLNDMVYNRCVGTRYCSNNCPYKVRRFNFLQYVDRDTETLKMRRNPHVSVRPRGVMEKCTYCVQRINAARVAAKVAHGDGRVAGDAIQTACQQACPTGAISFGNLTDSQSHVSQIKRSPLNYGILTELNTRPRTTYLARIKNPNPQIG